MFDHWGHVAADLEQFYGIDPYGDEFWQDSWTVNRTRILGLLAEPDSRLYRTIIGPQLRKNG